MGLWLKSISVRDYGPIKSLDWEFTDYNVVVGLNGSGKTWLMELIAGLTGPMGAEEKLLSNRECESVTIRVTSDGSERVFECSGKFDVQKIREFKLGLMGRTSFCITEPHYRYPDDEFAYYVGKIAHERFWNLMRHDEMLPQHFIKFEESGTQYTRPCGSGTEQLLRLAHSLRSPLVPYIWEFPEDHIHIMISKLFPDLFKGYQMILTTHSPEVLGSNMNNVLDVSRT